MKPERGFNQTVADLERHEGFRPWAYPDPLSDLAKNYPGERWGYEAPFKILARIGQSAAGGRPWTQGFGDTHNVDMDRPISREEARKFLVRELIEHIKVLDKLVPEWKVYPDFAKTVLANLAYNLGEKRLAQFKNTLMYFRERKWGQAAANLQKSLWYRQVGTRSRELVERLKLEMIQPQYIIPDFSNVISGVTSTEEVIRKGD